jgi:UDP-N-acetylglucosamine:LPS N-acetylglucosamine transferase
MATILLAWELGGGWGHHSRLAALSGLTERGHRVVVALQDARSAAKFLPSNMVTVAAPKLRREKALLIPRPHSFAQLLHNIGFGDPIGLAHGLAQWTELFRDVKPDLVVADYSPTAMLALRGMPIKCGLIGTGFTVPLPEYPFRNLRAWRPVDVKELSAFETRLTDTVNQVLRARGQPPLESLADLYRDPDLALLQTFPELDPYGERINVRYWGIGPYASGTAPIWPRGEGPKVFVYVRPFPALPSLLEHLNKRRVPTLVVCSGMPSHVIGRFESSTLKIESQPLNIAQVAREADLAILNGGHGTTSAMLLAGTPMLQVPVSLERTLNAHYASQLGAAESCPPDNAEKVISAFDSMLDSDRWKDAALRFAKKYAGFDPHRVGQDMLDAIEQLVA